MVEKRNGRVLSLVQAAPFGSPGKQQTNTRKPPVRIWQLSNSVAAGDGVIGFRLIGGDEAFVCQIDGADRDHVDALVWALASATTSAD